jgi:hypothetical protein
MRAAVFLAALLLGACASDRFSISPPAGVDFSGKWKLDEADSDDPQHLAQAAAPRAGTTDPNGVPIPPRGGGGEGQGQRGQGRRGAGGNRFAPGYQGPMAPPVAAMGAPLRFPGRLLEVKQVGGVVSFASEKRNRVCQPGTEFKKKPKVDPHSRDPMPEGRDAAPPECGWEGAILVLKGGDQNDDRLPKYEEQYSLSEDHQRLIESVVFIGGRSDGFVLSRVWERDTP